MKKILAFLFLIFAFTACSADAPAAEIPTEKSDYNNTITVLNVGQAQCSLIESDGQFMLLDAGFAEGETQIIDYLKQRGVEKIKLFVLTHFHTDHTSQTLDVLRNFQVENLLIPDLSVENTPTNSFYKALLEKAEKGQYNLYLAGEGQQFSVGEGTVTVLADTYNQKIENEGKNTSQRINNTSVALTFTMPDGFTMLDTGDAEYDVEQMLIDKVPRNVDFFNAGHHGSSDANSFKFLQKINPNFMVISCGRDNNYGHPHDKMLKRRDDLKLTYVITYEEGNIVYSMDENRWLEWME